MLPAAIVEADHRLHRVLERYAFSEHLNPENVGEAAAEFQRTGRDPHFRYRPLPDVEDALAYLAATECPDDHPAGVVLREALGDVACCIRALSERSAEAFHAWNERSGWYPAEGDLAPDPPQPDPDLLPEPARHTPADMVDRLRHALAERGWDWNVDFDPVMSSRVLVDATRRRVRVNPAAAFRARDLVGLVAHEIDVHVRRAENGARQPLKVFSTGLSQAGLAEEGLAVFAEERVGTLTASARWGQRLMAEAVAVAREASFAELARWLKPRGGSSAAWGISLRLKRGLAHTDRPGAYAKDSVYYIGLQRVRRKWREGGLQDLFVGKVGLHHDVGAWLAEGWVFPPAEPPGWLSPPE